MAKNPPLHTVLLAAALAAGCSNPGSPTKDATGLACPDPQSLMVAGTCNTVPFPSRRVPFTVGSGSAPSFVGGTLVDGLYAAIKAEGWNTSTGYGRQMGIVIGNDGATLLWFGQTLNADGTGDVDAGTTGLVWLRANFDLSISAAAPNKLLLSETCGAGTTTGPPELLFTATTGNPPQIALANAQASDPTTAVTTYERQGCP
jgi:hypothetical protein